ncbi:diaminopimelate decarboxylase [Crossiella equi]|uniref:Diaminopimelate decarboxylase n=1 Tax=Crossiella equi TaxID=130796 RepID=A0ABS5AH15_9PSEU|nr:diaminopimelate decarboxylase [Crossiella equi]MBP2475873.1 diaminopimelate decarboxylase [Crossiella equi]
MTLEYLIPSLHRSLRSRLEPGVWPSGTSLGDDNDLVVGGVSLRRIAAEHGTPSYVLDEDEVRARCRAYRQTLPDMEVAYASKALLTKAVARWVKEEGLSLDVCSAGELAVARAVDFPAERIILHGNAKTPEDLKAAIGYGVGRIVVDSFDEIEQLAVLARHPQQVMVRVTPGVDGHTHTAIATGVEDQKFGFSLRTGAAAEAVRRVLMQPNLHLVGLHCHIGSQVRQVADFEQAVRRMVSLLWEIRSAHGLLLPQLNIGGGHAVAYLPGEDEFDLQGFASRVRCALSYECSAHGLPVPRVVVEPGRSLVARAGVTLYRVVVVKDVPGVRTFVAVDGGMSDNLRPALYGAPYTVRMFGRASQAGPRTVTVVGRHCEAGDVIARDVQLPADIRSGDLLAVACTGAYHHSLASNYNLVGRPPVLAVGAGGYRPVIRRESDEDVLARDLG